MRQPQIISTRYVLAVQDLDRSVDYYKNQLGCSTVWTDGGWHALRRGSFFVMLGECPDDRSAFETRNHSYFAYVEVAHVDALYAELRTRDVEVISGPSDKPWGQREFAIRTVDGHRIMFGEELVGDTS